MSVLNAENSAASHQYMQCFGCLSSVWDMLSPLDLLASSHSSSQLCWMTIITSFAWLCWFIS